MSDLIADLNRIRERACSDMLRRDTPLDPAEVADACLRAVEALTPPEDVARLVETGRMFGRLIRSSQGIAGYHMNGDVEPWDDLEDVPDALADALTAQSAALAQVTRERDGVRLNLSIRTDELREATARAEAAEAQVSALTTERVRLREATNQCRLAFAGYVSVRSAVNKLDALAAEQGEGRDDAS